MNFFHDEEINKENKERLVKYFVLAVIAAVLIPALIYIISGQIVVANPY